VGLDQYAIKRFATALETFPKTLADNTGVNANDVVTQLYAAHEQGNVTFGIDIEVSKPIFSNSFLTTYLYWKIYWKINGINVMLKNVRRSMHSYSLTFIHMLLFLGTWVPGLSI